MCVLLGMTSATNASSTIRTIRPDDAPTWERLRCELWPDGIADHGPEIALFFGGKLPDVAEVLIAENSCGQIVAFAEISIRMDLPTLSGGRVGYVEALYVIREARGRGVTRALLQASRAWAREQNCSAFASDRADRIIIDKRFNEA